VYCPAYPLTRVVRNYKIQLTRHKTRDACSVWCQLGAIEMQS